MSLDIESATLAHAGPKTGNQPVPIRQSRQLAGGLVDLGRGWKSSKRTLEAPREIRRLYGPIVLLIVWSILSATHVLGPRVFPAPWDVVRAGIELTWEGTLQEHLWASLKRVIAGFVPGLAIGVTLAVLAGTLARFEDSVDSIMQVLKSIPEFTLVPLLIIWMGINDAPKITLITLSVSMPIYLNTYGAIRNVDARLIESARTLGLNHWRRVWHIVLPGSLPGFLVGLRIALTNAWLALVFAETINAQKGLGTLMSDARSWWQLDIMVLVIAIYAVLGLISHAFVRLLERRLLAWRRGYLAD